MGKTKKKPAQNSNVVASIHGIKYGSIQRKNPKFKSESGIKTALINNLKVQNENKLSQKNLQKTINIKKSQNLLKKNTKKLKEYSQKEKKNVSNKLQNKPANKQKNLKRKLEDDSDSDINESVLPQDCTVSTNSKEFEKEKKIDTQDILEQSLADKIKKDHEYYQEDKEKKKEQTIKYRNVKIFDDNDDDNDDDVEDDNKDEEHENVKNENNIANIIHNEDISEERTNFSLVNIVKDNIRRIEEEEYRVPFPTPVYNITVIRIGNLPMNITKKKIEKKFEKYGLLLSSHIKCFQKEILDCSVEHPKRPRTITEADISYQSFRKAKGVIKKMNGKTFAGNVITVRFKGDFICPFLLFDRSKTVFLENLAFGIDNNSIWKIFNQCGEIKHVFLNLHSTGFIEGEGLVVFMTEDAAREAVKLNNTEILGEQVRVTAGFTLDNLDTIIQDRSILETILLDEEKVKVIVNKRLKELELKFKDKEFQKNFKLEKAMTRKNEDEKRKPQKSNIGLVEKKQISLQGQKTNFKKKKNNTKSNKQKWQKNSQSTE